MMLMNVLYFRSPWQYKFYSPSEPRPFYVEGTKSVDAQFMSQEDYFGYADLKDLDAELVELPYKVVIFFTWDPCIHFCREKNDLNIIFL
jgi:serine protease inhibitor